MSFTHSRYSAAEVFSYGISLINYVWALLIFFLTSLIHSKCNLIKLSHAENQVLNPMRLKVTGFGVYKEKVVKFNMLAKLLLPQLRNNTYQEEPLLGKTFITKNKNIDYLFLKKYSLPYLRVFFRVHPPV